MRTSRTSTHLHHFDNHQVRRVSIDLAQLPVCYGAEVAKTDAPKIAAQLSEVVTISTDCNKLPAREVGHNSTQ